VRDRIRASPPRATARRGVPTRRAASSLLAVRARNAPAGCGGTGERVRRPVPRVGCEAGQGVPLRTRLARVVNTYCLPSFSAATGSFTTYSAQRHRGEGASGWGRVAHNRLPPTTTGSRAPAFFSISSVYDLRTVGATWCCSTSAPRVSRACSLVEAWRTAAAMASVSNRLRLCDGRKTRLSAEHSALTVALVSAKGRNGDLRRNFEENGAMTRSRLLYMSKR